MREEGLRARDAQFRALIEELHAGVALIDSQGRFSVYNRRFLEIFGLPLGSDVLNVNSRDWSGWQVLDEAGRPLDVDDHPVRRVVLTRQPVRERLVAVRPPDGGDSKWLLVSAEPLLAADGAIEQIICTYNEVTEQRRATELARKSDALAKAQAVELEAILACIADGVLVYDSEGRTVGSNPAADGILGVPPGERRAPVQDRVMRQYEIVAEDGHRVLRDEMVAVRAAIRR